MSSMYPSFGGAPSRPCMRCGIQLAINETQCSRCGTYNPLPQGQQFGMFQQGAQGGNPGTSGSLWGGQSQQAAPNQQPGNGVWPGAQGTSAPSWGAGGQAGGGWQQNNNNLFGGQGQTAQPSQPLQQNLFGSGFAGQNPSSFLNGAQNPNQSAFNGSFPGAGFQQTPERPSLNTFFQATQQKNGYGGGASPMAPNRPAWMKKPGDDDGDDNDSKGKNRPSPGVIVVIIILVVVLLGGGGYGGYYLWHHRNGGAANTANVQTIVTPSTTPLFSDTFQNNTNGWSTTAPTGAKVTLGGGKFILESDNNTLFPELLPGGKVFGDFRLDIDANLTSGNASNGYGIYIRAASTQNSILGLYYRFEVYGNGNFVVYKGSLTNNGGLQVGNLVTSSNASAAINHAEGALNHLTIIAKGQAMTFIVNNTTVANFTDATYKSGTIALFVSNLQNVAAGAQATFEHMAIFPAQ